jgi:hypothetical protein
MTVAKGWLMKSITKSKEFWGSQKNLLVNSKPDNISTKKGIHHKNRGTTLTWSDMLLHKAAAE